MAQPFNNPYPFPVVEIPAKIKVFITLDYPNMVDAKIHQRPFLISGSWSALSTTQPFFELGISGQRLKLDGKPWHQKLILKNSNNPLTFMIAFLDPGGSDAPVRCKVFEGKQKT